MANLRINNLHKGFEGFSIIKGIDLEVNDREVVVFVGPSGCGKSTLLRVVGGLLRTKRGTVLVDPQDCALVFQDARLLRWLTVAENLALALANHPRRERQERIADALALMQLQGIQHHLPSELSGGMAQRVMAGRQHALYRHLCGVVLGRLFAAVHPYGVFWPTPGGPAENPA